MKWLNDLMTRLDNAVIGMGNADLGKVLKKRLSPPAPEGPAFDLEPRPPEGGSAVKTGPRLVKRGGVPVEEASLIDTGIQEYSVAQAKQRLETSMAVLRRAASLEVPLGVEETTVEQMYKSLKAWRTIGMNVVLTYDALQAAKKERG